MFLALTQSAWLEQSPINFPKNLSVHLSVQISLGCHVTHEIHVRGTLLHQHIDSVVPYLLHNGVCVTEPGQIKTATFTGSQAVCKLNVTVGVCERERANLLQYQLLQVGEVDMR